MLNLLRNAVLCVAGVALAILAGSIATAQGSDSGNVRVEVTPVHFGGVLSVSITNADLGEYEYSLDDRQVTGGTITIVVADMRGDASGWSVTIAASDFVNMENPASSFGVSLLHLSPGSMVAIPATGHSSNAAPDAMALAPNPSSPQLAIRAEPGTGAGIYVNGRPADLTIPGGTLVGDYQATIIVSITGAAPGD